MPDTSAALENASAPIASQQADGWVVVSWFRDPASVVPPAKGSYSYDHYTHLNDALDAYDDLERGEYRKFEAVGVFPAKGGLPVGSPLSPQMLALAARERRAA